MTNSSLQARFARLGPVREIARVSSGSPEDVLLTPAVPAVAVITAAHALARRGISLLKATRTIEAMAIRGKTILHLPMVESRTALADDLATAGIALTIRTLPDELKSGILAARLKALRARLGMTQEQFALQFGFEQKTLKGWEQGRRVDRGNISYITIIERDPVSVARIADTA